jgi:hypothetical protein
MAKGRFWYNSVNFKYVLTATTEATGADVENVLYPFPSNVWRSTTNGDQYVAFDSSTARTIAAVYIGNHNVSSFTTFEVQCSNNDFSTHDDYNLTSLSETRTRVDSDGEVEDYTYRSAYAIIAGSYQDIRIKINSTVSYYEIGFIGIYTADYTFPQNWVTNFRWGWKNQIITNQSENGSTYIKHQYSRREGALQFRYITSAQLLILTRQIPLNNHIVFAPDGLTSLFLVGVELADIPGNLQTISDDYKTIDINIVEKI